MNQNTLGKERIVGRPLRVIVAGLAMLFIVAKPLEDMPDQDFLRFPRDAEPVGRRPHLNCEIWHA